MYYYIYILQSITYPERYYVGCTPDLKERIKRHNEGGSLHTSKYIPWKMTTAISFSEKHKAFAFNLLKDLKIEKLKD